MFTFFCSHSQYSYVVLINCQPPPHSFKPQTILVYTFWLTAKPRSSFLCYTICESILHACVSPNSVVDPANRRRRNLRQSAVDQRRTEPYLRPAGLHVPADNSAGVPVRGCPLLRERDRHRQSDLQRDREAEHQNHPGAARRVDEVFVFQPCKAN